MLKSVRVRLALWYSAGLTLILCVFSAALYQLLANSIRGRLDARLASAVDVMEAALRHEIEEHGDKTAGEQMFQQILVSIYQATLPEEAVCVWENRREVGCKSEVRPGGALRVVFPPAPSYPALHLWTTGRQRNAVRDVPMPSVASTYRIVVAASEAPMLEELARIRSILRLTIPFTVLLSALAGTPFSGTLVFDDAQTVMPVSFWGGTHSSYSFTSMSLTVGTTTVTWGPGVIDVYDNVTSTGGGYPVGDSFYANVSSPVAPNGTINGAQFNWIFLGLVDPTGTVFSGSALPANLNLASFQNPFIEFNYGTAGTAWGAGNTSTLQFLSSLSKTGGTPTPPPTITTTALPAGVIGVAYSAPVTASGPNGDPVTVTVAGLPGGLSFNGASIAGTPLAVGTSSVAVTATDTVTRLSTSSTLPLTINDAAISFTPMLPSGVTNYPDSTTFPPAAGGTGSFT